MTVLGARSLTGITAAMTREGSTDTPVFLTFVQKMFAPALRSGQIVIMDHRSAHKVEGVKEAIESVGATNTRIFPSYSPDVSPIEEGGSKFKEHLRAKAARTREL